ncbi:MAG: AAA family ATPase [Anaerolineae bacterium]|nr:AAA family ATPase [Anaerolineae bacterium]
MLAEIDCPYRGMEPFRYEHAEFYFGREAMTQALVEKVRDHPLVTVVGPSGCGKSSLVHAGLISALTKGVLPESERWAVRVFRPGNDPMQALAASLIILLEPEASEVDRLTKSRELAQALRSGAVLIADVLTRLHEKQPDVPRLVLIADQFEELYTECQDEESRKAFVRMLLAAAQQKTITVVLTLRADFFGHVLAERGLGQVVDAGQVSVLPMSEEGLQAAIEQPALETGRAFEPGLVQRILADVRGQPGSLPLLEFALTELWARQTREGLLTHGAYEDIGRVAGAIAKRAETTYEELEKQDRGEIAQRIFVRLTHYGVGIEETRRRATFDELVTPQTPHREVARTVKALTDARLLVTGQDQATREATVEISHEALIRDWERLRRWLEEDQAFGMWREKLGSALRNWQETRQDKGDLLRSARLTEAESWLAERGVDLNQGEQEFVRASLTLREQEEAKRRATERLRRWVVGFVVVAIITSVLAALTAHQRDQAVAARTAAEGLKLGFASRSEIDRNHELALLLAVEAWRISPSVEAEQVLRSSLSHQGRTLALFTGHGEAVEYVAWSPDNRYMATASDDDTARVWDAKSGKALTVLVGHTSDVNYVAWDPAGRRIVTASDDSTARVWDAKTGELLTTLPVSQSLIVDIESWTAVPDSGHIGAVNRADWSPDGTRILTAGDDKSARIWDAESGEQLANLTGHTAEVLQAVWDPEGTRILTGSKDHTARVWDADTHAVLAVLTGHTGAVLDVEWSPDSAYMATASNDCTVRVWDSTSGTELAVLTKHLAGVRHIAWDTAGIHIVTSSWDGTARIWDVPTALRTGGEQADYALLANHGAAVLQAGWSSDGSRLVTASQDGTARVWDTEDWAQLSVLTGHSAGVSHAAWNIEGDRIATASYDGTVRLWDISSAGEIALLAGHSELVWRAAWDNTGRRIVTASSDGTARVWDAETGKELVVLTGHRHWLSHAAWDASSSRILTTSADGTIRIWDAESGAELASLVGHEEAVSDAAWNPASDRIVSVGWDGAARVWDVSGIDSRGGEGIELGVLRGHTGWILHVAWDRAEDRFVTAGWDGTARVWNASNLLDIGDGRSELAVLAGHTDWVSDAAWSPDDSRIVTTSADGAVRVWDAESGAVLRVLTGHTDWVLDGEWSPDGRRVATASRDGTARVWDADTGIELAVLTGHNGAVSSVAWSPGGDLILTTGWDGAAQVWETEHWSKKGVLTGHSGGILNAAWNPDGTHIVTAGYDGTSRIYYARSEELPVEACRRAVRNMSEEEWRQYMGDEPYRETCPGKPVPGRDF